MIREKKSEQAWSTPRTTGRNERQKWGDVAMLRDVQLALRKIASAGPPNSIDEHLVKLDRVRWVGYQGEARADSALSAENKAQHAAAVARLVTSRHGGTQFLRWRSY